MKKIMFWSETFTPQSVVRDDIPKERRDAIAAFLRDGHIINTYRGFARCRICHVALGSSDMTGADFMWPARAEHYVQRHGVWLVEFDEILSTLGATP
jgi:hypothetical protein